MSHDRYFINRIANKVLVLQPDGVQEYLGNYDDYLEKKRLEEAGALSDTAPGVTRTQQEKEKRKKRLIQESEKQLKARIQQTENDIAVTEELIEALETQMGDPDVYRDGERAAQVAHQHEDAQKRLEELYEEWEELTDAAENF